jgi:hypothetical protein
LRKINIKQLNIRFENIPADDARQIVAGLGSEILRALASSEAMSNQSGTRRIENLDLGKVLKESGKSADSVRSKIAGSVCRAVELNAEDGQRSR